MSAIYRREVDTGPSGVIVRWTPDDIDIGRQSVIKVVGEPDEWPVEVSNDEAEQIRKKYNELMEASK